MKILSKAILILSLVFITKVECKAQTSFSPSMGSMDLGLDKLFENTTAAFSVVNLTFTIINVTKLNDSKPDLKFGPEIFLVSGILQSALGVGLLSENSSESKGLGMVNLLVGTSTSVTSLLRLSGKKIYKQKTLSLKPIYCPKSDYGLGLRLKILLG